MADHGASLQTFALGAVSAIAGVDGNSPETAFLRRHWETAGGDQWPRAFQAYLDRAASNGTPLRGLGSLLGLHPVEMLTASLASAVEIDMMCGRALARVQAPVGGSRPTVGLLASAFAPANAAARSVVQTILTGAAMRCGLITLLQDGAPVAERPVAVPLPTCLALTGADAPWPGAVIGSDGGETVPLPASVRTEAERQARALETGGLRALIVRSGSISEGRSIASSIAAALGRRPLFIENGAATTGIVPLLLLRGLIPVFCMELGPGEQKDAPGLPCYDGPVLALCGPEGSVDFGGEPAGEWAVGPPPRDERRALWDLAIGGPHLSADLAKYYRHGTGRIAYIGRLARHRAALDGRDSVAPDDLLAASWAGENSGLEALAQALRDPVADDAMVVPPNLRKELERLHLRCLSRDGLADGLGISAATRYRTGVRALFTGPSGTGKTLAASWLATRLRLPLYRVDLASITSKYIGETEKNLSQLMARAEQSEVVLLFDEADSLFARRTEVRDSNDRFANAQTNYLLQRIENFDGIAILTANSRARFDNAFARRLDAVIEFPLPGPAERRDIWQSHLGPKHELSMAELNCIAVVADITGGNIRNAVLFAAVLAQSAERTIAYPDLVEGLANEYRKLGRQMPLELMSV